MPNNVENDGAFGALLTDLSKDVYICLLRFVSLSTSLFMYHLFFFSPRFIVHVLFCFLQSTVHLIHLIYYSSSHSHLSYLVALILHCQSALLSVSLFSQSLFLETNNLAVSLDKVLVLDRYSLLKAKLGWFYYSLSLYIKQEIQNGVRSGIS